MQQRVYHGKVTPQSVAQDLMAHFHRGNLRVQQIGSGERIAVQIATSQQPISGGQTALSITLQKVEDGVIAQVGSQAWLGVAASLGITALFAMRNPFSLVGRLDDIAQDIQNLQLQDEVWGVIDASARAAGAAYELSERLRRTVCEYCGVAVPVGESSCIACGAPLGNVQPVACPRCGFVVKAGERACPNCGQQLQPGAGAKAATP